MNDIKCSSPLFSSGDIYHCSELDCPVHGERNKIMKLAEMDANLKTKEEALRNLSEAFGID